MFSERKLRPEQPWLKPLNFQLTFLQVCCCYFSCLNRGNSLSRLLSFSAAYLALTFIVFGKLYPSSIVPVIFAGFNLYNFQNFWPAAAAASESCVVRAVSYIIILSKETWRF
jgi:hypothetical protein